MKNASSKAAVGVTVALELYNIYSAHKDHQQMVNEERNRVMGAKRQAESIIADIKLSLVNDIDEVIVETFNGLILNYKGVSKKLDNDASLLLLKKERLQALLNSLSLVGGSCFADSSYQLKTRASSNSSRIAD